LSSDGILRRSAARLGASVLVAALLLRSVAPAEAGGIWLYEMATPDQGTAAAGRAALAVDPSTAWLNPPA
jgi:long-chain fatty acid transport protein